MAKITIKNDYVFNLLNKIYSVLMGLMSSVFLTRYLGLNARGNYSYINQIISVLSIILNLGIHQSYSYFYKKNSKDLFEKYLAIYIYEFIIICVIGFLLLFHFRDRTEIIYVLLLLPFNVINQQMESTMAVENIRLKINVHLIIVTLRVVFLGLIYFYFESSLFWPIIANITLNIVSFTIYLRVQKINYSRIFVNLNLFISILNFSWIPMLTALLITLNYSVDIFFLKNLSTAVDLSLYSVAVGIVNYFWLIPDSFKEVLLSKVSREYSLESTIFTIKISVFLVCCTIILFIAFGKHSIIVLFGKEFISSYLICIILSLGSISMVYYKMIGVILLSEGRRYVYFIFLLISVILNVIGNYLFIPSFGIYGAAYSSVISYSSCGILFLFYFIYIKKIPLYKILFFSRDDILKLKLKFKELR